MAADSGSWHLVDLLASTAIIACGWLWRQIAAKAGKDDLAEAVRMLKDQHATILERVDEHYEESKEHRDRLELKFDEVNKGLGATMVALSRLQGQLDRNDERRTYLRGDP